MPGIYQGSVDRYAAVKPKEKDGYSLIMDIGQCVVDSCRWEEPPGDLIIPSDEVHVWRASLARPADCIQQLAQMLSADERLRAGRFHFQRDRLHFIIGRGMLRTILGQYLGVDPARLRFEYSSHGKPSLEPKGFETPVGLVPCFSISHAHGLALCAVTCNREVGVDLELIRPISEVEQLVESFFSSREKAIFQMLPASRRQEAFFNCWTRKEAYLKASGDGLARPLDEVEALRAQGESAWLLRIAGDFQEASRWSIRDLLPASGYTAALVVEGHAWQLKCWDFDDVCRRGEVRPPVATG